MSRKLTLQRSVGKKTGEDKIKKQIEYLISRGLGGNRGSTWDHISSRYQPPYQKNGKWVFTCTVEFYKNRGRQDSEFSQWQEIRDMIIQAGSNTKFNPYPWIVLSEGVGENEQEPLPGDQSKPEEEISTQAIVQNIVRKTEEQKDGGVETPLMSWEDLSISEELLNDGAISNHPEFQHIYGVEPQIRTLLAAICSGIQSKGQQRDHCVLWGHAGCGKTTTLLALEKLLGRGSIMRLDATSTSRAGIEELVFGNKYPISSTPDGEFVHLPPIVVCEEIEKADENALKVWLGALDDRGEIRKNKQKRQYTRKVRVLFICTVNNKSKFDNMMGSDGTQPGALSSRCVTEIYFPRPNQETLRKILQLRIEMTGGNLEWIKPALELGYELGYTDPRKFRALLAGGDRLLDGSYQRDRLAIHECLKEN